MFLRTTKGHFPCPSPGGAFAYSGSELIVIQRELVLSQLYLFCMPQNSQLQGGIYCLGYLLTAY